LSDSAAPAPAIAMRSVPPRFGVPAGPPPVPGLACVLPQAAVNVPVDAKPAIIAAALRKVRRFSGAAMSCHLSANGKKGGIVLLDPDAESAACHGICAPVMTPALSPVSRRDTVAGRSLSITPARVPDRRKAAQCWTTFTFTDPMCLYGALSVPADRATTSLHSGLNDRARSTGKGPAMTDSGGGAPGAVFAEWMTRRRCSTCPAD
jgi:hypothetical protein